MADRLLKVKKKGNNGWMKGFVLPERTSEEDRIMKERMELCTARRVRLVQSNRNR
jgi:hypothetical protein